MKTIGRQAVLIWVVATILHLPLPVIDTHPRPSHDSRSAHCGCSASQEVSLVDGFSRLWNVEILLVGCLPFDDPDEGPLEGDLDGGVFLAGLFPLFLPLQIAGAGDNHLRVTDLVPVPLASLHLTPVERGCSRNGRQTLNDQLVSWNLLTAETVVIRC